ncbi:GNAT family N-acetyltransferase [Caldalkalibacillus salinus]|uniref:GNAT family N-acetyltransferase n=1 Tax=Caldalkalibacillus salinus TaxID=2803787 RepID=UPI001923F7B4|nr:GNAT family N-acetyltransferase [Caldalkalibacillus salinus]
MRILETARLSLREMTEEDIPYLLQIFTDPQAMAYYSSTKNEAEARTWVRWVRSCYEKSGIGLWIVEETESSRFIGQVGLMPQVIAGRDEVEIGYSLVRHEWNKGYATEAAIGCRDYGFHHLGLTRLISIIDPRHTKSRNVALKVGMEWEKQIIKWEKNVDIYAISVSRQHDIERYGPFWKEDGAQDILQLKRAHKNKSW